MKKRVERSGGLLLMLEEEWQAFFTPLNKTYKRYKDNSAWTKNEESRLEKVLAKAVM